MARAEEKARTLLDSLGLTQPPIDLNAVARELGVLVVHEVHEPSVSGILLRRAGQIAIGLNPQRSEVSQGFTLAHLIGHLQIHHNRDLLLDVVNPYMHDAMHAFPTEREEAEANRFAAAFLAPEPAVRRFAKEIPWETGDQLVDLMAAKFHLSRTVAAYRLMFLGVIADL